jgi:hypothetical protein
MDSSDSGLLSHNEIAWFLLMVTDCMFLSSFICPYAVAPTPVQFSCSRSQQNLTSLTIYVANTTPRFIFGNGHRVSGLFLLCDS